MDDLYDTTLIYMERTLQELCARVPSPKSIPFKHSFVFRHTEQTIHQALVQKLARLVSALDACRLLLNHGLFQEQGAMQRILDELNEDITFLSYGLIKNNKTALQIEYLKSFFEEEFDNESALKSTQKRPTVSRRKIHAYNAQFMSPAVDQSTGIELLRTLSKTYSGFIHAASPHIMDMYGGDPPKFHVRGMLGTEREAGYRKDIWNYFYRSIGSFALVARAFGDTELLSQVRSFSIEFERQSGQTAVQ